MGLILKRLKGSWPSNLEIDFFDKAYQELTFYAE